MIALIAADVDGTLLENGMQELSDRVVEQMNALQEAGVLFAAASGRQYPNLKHLFRRVKGDVLYICENGALVVYKNKVIHKLPILRTMGLELMEDIWTQKDCEILLSGKTTSYLLPKQMRFYEYMEQVVGNQCTLMQHPNQVQEEYIKISAYCKEGITPYTDYFKERWQNRLNVAVSGQCWIDFNNRNANKGTALHKVQQQFGISVEDTVALGDNFNDLEMFEQCYFSYAMRHADSEVRRKAHYVTEDVESVLQDVLYLRQR